MVDERSKPSSKKPAAKKESILSCWTKEEIEKITKAFIKFPAGTANRWEQVTLFVGGDKTINDIVKMSKELCIRTMKSESQLLEQMENVMRIKQKQEDMAAEKNVVKKEKVVEKKVVVEEKKEKKEFVMPDPGVWSQSQQNSLQMAMVKFPAKLDKKERWTKISDYVGDKTIKECFARVKQIKKQLADKKAAEAAAQK